jgi:hypothetical protein
VHKVDRWRARGWENRMRSSESCSTAGRKRRGEARRSGKKERGGEERRGEHSIPKAHYFGTGRSRYPRHRRLGLVLHLVTRAIALINRCTSPEAVFRRYYLLAALDSSLCGLLPCSPTKRKVDLMLVGFLLPTSTLRGPGGNHAFSEVLSTALRRTGGLEYTLNLH